MAFFRRPSDFSFEFESNSSSKEPGYAISRKPKMHNWLSVFPTYAKHIRGSDISLQDSVRDYELERAQRSDTTWKSEWHYSIVAMSAMIGIESTLWFPISCLKHGIGAYNVAFVVIVLVFGLPLYYLETALGQFSAHDIGATLTEIGPAWKGYSFAVIFVQFFLIVTYMPVAVQSSIYFYYSTQEQPLYHLCTSEYNTPECYTYDLDLKCKQTYSKKHVYFNKKCMLPIDVCENFYKDTEWNGTHCLKIGETYQFDFKRNLAESDFFERYLYRTHDTLPSEMITSIPSPTLIALLVCWLLVASSNVHGFRSLLYTLPITLVIPLVMVVSIFVHSVITANGNQSLFNAESFSGLLSTDCWISAFKNVFVAFNLGTGMNTLLASKNTLTYDSKQTSFVLVLFFLGFSLLTEWNMALVMGQLVTLTGTDTLENAFKQFENQDSLVVISSAFSLVSESPVWRSMFFLSIALLDIGTVQILVATMTDSLRIYFSEFDLDKYSIFSTLVSCLLMFLCNLMFISKRGIFVNLFFSRFALTYFPPIMALIENIAVMICLKVEIFVRQIRDEMILPMRFSGSYFTWSWKLLCPTGMFVMLLVYMVSHTVNRLHFNSYAFPAWCDGLGVVFVSIPVILIIIYIFYRLKKCDDVIEAKFLFKPTEKWTPGLRFRMQGGSSIMPSMQRMSEAVFFEHKVFSQTEFL